MKEWSTNTVNIHKSTKNRLKELGKKDDTYNDIIRRLIDHWHKTHK